MRFGTDNKGLIILTALLIFFSSACSQTKEEKIKSVKEHSDKALELRYKGDIKGAIQEQLKAIESNQDDAELSVNLIAYYLDDKNTEKAKETAEMALKITPNNAWVNYLYGEILEKNGKYDSALKYRSKAVEIDPENYTFLSNLASVQESLGDKESAKNNFKKALKINPTHIFALHRLGQLEEEYGNEKEAVGLFEKVIGMPESQYEIGDESFIKDAKERLAKLRSKKP
jgi:tetratricopeptide (TPR) repeat protein